MDSVTERLVRHYDKCLEEHRGTPKEVDWNEHSARNRYKAFANVVKRGVTFGFDDNVGDVLDWGCGTGSFTTFIDPFSKYLGYDPSEAMISEAKKRHGDWFNFTTDEPTNKKFEVIIANGVFTVRLKTSWIVMRQHLEETLDKLWDMTETVLAFNVMNSLSLSKEKQRDSLFFMDYNELDRLARAKTNKIVLDASYCPYEVMVQMWR